MPPSIWHCSLGTRLLFLEVSRMRMTVILALLFVTCAGVYSQAVPSGAVGKANLSYSFRYSESAETGGTLGDWHTITPSASLDYSNGSKKFPFSLEFAGGYTAALSGPSYTAGAFQHLSISQGITRGRWNLLGSDDISYRPQAPTTGFSGIPGTGEPIGGVSSTPASQLILTLNTHALENVAQGELTRALNYRSSLNVEAGQVYLHYPDSNGIDSRSWMGGAGLDLRLGARTSFTTLYSFSQISYSGYNFHFMTNTGMIGAQRAWTRSLSMSGAVGPQWVSASSNAFPLTTYVAAQAAASYQRRSASFNLSYSRSIDAGSGYMVGSKADQTSAGLSRQFHRDIVLEMNGGYRHSSELTSPWVVSGAYGGVQGTWRIGRNLSAFANYTATSQNSTQPVPSNVLEQLMQTFSFGIGFTKGVRPGK